jgi:hypothetical protein
MKKILKKLLENKIIVYLIIPALLGVIVGEILFRVVCFDLFNYF